MRWLVGVVALQSGAGHGLFRPAKIIDTVTCATDSSQTYALFCPCQLHPVPCLAGHLCIRSRRTRDAIQWNAYQAAATQYGFIVAGSNNSRNGSPEFLKAVETMSGRRDSRASILIPSASMWPACQVDPAWRSSWPSSQRASPEVIASSAGYPDNQPRKSVRFPIFRHGGHRGFQPSGNAPAGPRP